MVQLFKNALTDCYLLDSDNNQCDFDFTAETREKLIESMLTKSLKKPDDSTDQHYASMSAEGIRVHSCQFHDHFWSTCIADITGLSGQVSRY